MLKRVPEEQLELLSDEELEDRRSEEELLGQEVRFRYREEKWRDYYGTNPIQTLDGVAARVAAVHLNDGLPTLTLQFPGQTPIGKRSFLRRGLGEGLLLGSASSRGPEFLAEEARRVLN